MQLLLEIAVAHLLQDVRVTGFVDLECLAAMGADDFVHGYVRSIVRVGVDKRGSAAKRRAVRAGSREVMLFIGSGTWSHPTVAGQGAPASGKRLKTEADVCERTIPYRNHVARIAAAKIDSDLFRAPSSRKRLRQPTHHQWHPHADWRCAWVASVLIVPPIRPAGAAFENSRSGAR
ncbi:hypothetical protein D9M72_508340 [compost metagenome]